MNRPGYIWLDDAAQRKGWPSRAVLYQIVRAHGIKRYKFPGDRRTYVRRDQLARALRRPSERA